MASSPYCILPPLPWQPVPNYDRRWYLNIGNPHPAPRLALLSLEFDPYCRRWAWELTGFVRRHGIRAYRFGYSPTLAGAQRAALAALAAYLHDRPIEPPSLPLTSLGRLYQTSLLDGEA